MFRQLVILVYIVLSIQTVLKHRKKHDHFIEIIKFTTHLIQLLIKQGRSLFHLANEKAVLQESLGLCHVYFNKIKYIFKRIVRYI